MSVYNGHSIKVLRMTNWKCATEAHAKPTYMEPIRINWIWRFSNKAQLLFTTRMYHIGRNHVSNELWKMINIFSSCVRKYCKMALHLWKHLKDCCSKLRTGRMKMTEQDLAMQTRRCQNRNRFSQMYQCSNQVNDGVFSGDQNKPQS